MPHRPQVARFELDAKTFVHLDGRPGTELASVDGWLWITQDGCAVDIELAAGQRFVVTVPARLVVCGFGPATLQVTRQAPATARSMLWREVRRLVESPSPAAAEPTTIAA